MTTSALDQIEGIGKITKDKLLLYFGTIERIRTSDIASLNSLVNKKQAKIIYDHFRKTNQE